MEHARKMVFIPEETFKKNSLMPESTQQQQQQHNQDESNEDSNKIKSVQTPGTVLSRLDSEMYKILNFSNKSAYDKWQLYSQVLHRFLQFLKDDDLDVNTESILNIDRSDDSSDEKKIILSQDRHILETVPQKYRDKANQLISRLHQAGKHHIFWDKSDKVYINGQQIEGSNIVDLINDAMRWRKKFSKPIGREQFSHLIEKIGVPREFIGNEKFWSKKQNEKATPLNLKRSRKRLNLDVPDTPTQASKRKKSNAEGSQDEEDCDDEETL